FLRAWMQPLDMCRPLIFVRGKWRGFFTLYPNPTSLVMTPGRKMHTSIQKLVRPTTGRGWRWIGTEGSYMFLPAQLPMIFMEETVLAKIFLPTPYLRSTPKRASASGITSWYTMIFWIGIHLPHPTCSQSAKMEKRLMWWHRSPSKATCLCLTGKPERLSIQLKKKQYPLRMLPASKHGPPNLYL